eukprot:3249766-Rhodomonas_salina.1
MRIYQLYETGSTSQLIPEDADLGRGGCTPPGAWGLYSCQLHSAFTVLCLILTSAVLLPDINSESFSFTAWVQRDLPGSNPYLAPQLPAEEHSQQCRQGGWRGAGEAPC